MEDKKSLARNFCPVIRFHKKESYTPTNFIELFKTEEGNINFACSRPERNWERKAKFDIETGLKWFSPTIYVHFLEDIEIEIGYKKQRVPLIIQYYYYFAYNEFFWGEFKVPFLNHNHDWEIIQLALTQLGENKHYEILSYSISAHGTFIEINDQIKIRSHNENGFHCNRGAHNFGSILYQPNQFRKDDIIIKPNTLIPIFESKRVPFKDGLIFLDEEYKREYLNKFQFFPLRPPWNREFYNSATWIPEYWSWSLNRQLTQLSRLIRLPYKKPP